MNVNAATIGAIRFGTGFRPGEDAAASPEALLGQLDAARETEGYAPSGGLAARKATLLEIAEKLREANDLRRDGQRAESAQLRRAVRRQAMRLLFADRHRRFAHAVASPHGFFERLAWFWTDHFSVSARKGVPGMLLTPLFEVEAIRPHLAGPFRDLLAAAVLHPAMLTYLDQSRSVGPNSPVGLRGKRGLNENLGRELLELHTMGAGSGYGQDDVRAAALVLTGMDVRLIDPTDDFRRAVAEPGPITLLGTEFGGLVRRRRDVVDMLDHLAGMAVTAGHICRKLAVHFVSDEPPEALVSMMVRTWKGTNGDLAAVYRTMLEHPAAWTGFGAKARQPFDFIVAGLRALDVPASALAMPDPAKALPDKRRAQAADKIDADDMAGGMEPDMAPEMAEDMAEGMAPDKNTDTAPEMDSDADDGAVDAAATAMAAREAKRVPGNPFTVAAAARMGQPLWEPPSPAGWEEDFDVWISSSQLALRIGWARAAGSTFGARFEPADLLRTALADAARAETATIVRQAPSRAAASAFILSSPEFNRR